MTRMLSMKTLNIMEVETLCLILTRVFQLTTTLVQANNIFHYMALRMMLLRYQTNKRSINSKTNLNYPNNYHSPTITWLCKKVTMRLGEARHLWLPLFRLSVIIVQAVAASILINSLTHSKIHNSSRTIKSHLTKILFGENLLNILLISYQSLRILITLVNSDQLANTIKQISNNFSFPLRSKHHTSTMGSLVLMTISNIPRDPFQLYIHNNRTNPFCLQEELMVRLQALMSFNTLQAISFERT